MKRHKRTLKLLAIGIGYALLPLDLVIRLSLLIMTVEVWVRAVD